MQFQGSGEMNRREWLQYAGVTLAAPATLRSQDRSQRAAAPSDDRALWIDTLRRLADPVLQNLANETLRARMPVEQAAGANRGRRDASRGGRAASSRASRRGSSCDGDAADEGSSATRYRTWPAAGIDRARRSRSPDFLNFTRDRQPLVDAAFLAQGVMRAPPRAAARAWSRRAVAICRRARVGARRSRRRSTTGCCFRRRSKPRSTQLGARWDACVSTTRCASTTSGTGRRRRTVTGRRFTGTTTTASSSTR